MHVHCGLISTHVNRIQSIKVLDRASSILFPLPSRLHQGVVSCLLYWVIIFVSLEIAFDIEICQSHNVGATLDSYLVVDRKSATGALRSTRNRNKITEEKRGIRTV